jgi:hypothetical protein
MSYYKTLTCFVNEVPSSGSFSVQRRGGLTRRSSYYGAITEVIEILNIKIIKYIKYNYKIHKVNNHKIRML